MLISIIEIIVCALVIVMLFNEEKIARWEEKVFCSFKRKSLKLKKGFVVSSETATSSEEQTRANA